ncbi:MAG TPA: SDR family NAD(P)-dependent oxidoreductase [Verrucomicrobiae bacterium]|nr:SDR family NAD(P)-dependent oxidoreductase [Verrucomicrobiae bacterium]
MDDHDKPIIISGGSKGLGLVMVIHCLQRGCPVATFARHPTADVQALGMKFPDQFHFESIDATQADRVDAFVTRVAERFGPIYGLVNNAALGQDHLLSHISPEIVDSIIAVNLKAPILLTRSVIRRMLLNPTGGRIVNVTSICGARGYAGLTVYSATKGGLDAFTRSLARELGGRRILVNALAPGFFASEMSSVLAADQLETIRRRTPTERLCTQEEMLPILDMLLFANTNLTGQTIYVDGGAGI